jgi:hypothetical protein
MATSPYLLRAAQSLSGSLVVAFVVIACGGSADTQNTGAGCMVAKDCYANVTGIHGQVSCLTQVTGGYCTHSCSTDADCCAAKNECSDATAHPEVCAPLENNGATNCFLSCEGDVLQGMDPDAYCASFANHNFTCRSTGGGSANRKVCLP